MTHSSRRTFRAQAAATLALSRTSFAAPAATPQPRFTPLGNITAASGNQQS